MCAPARVCVCACVRVCGGGGEVGGSCRVVLYGCMVMWLCGDVVVVVWVAWMISGVPACRIV